MTHYGSISQSDHHNPSIDKKKKLERSVCWKISLSVISNITNALLGVSIFSMPWGFQQAGLIGGVLVLMIMSAVSFATARALLLAQRYIFLKTKYVEGYPEIAAYSIGDSWSIVIQVATIISCVGGNVGYHIFLGQITSQLLSISFTNSVLGLCIPLIILSWIRSFRELSVFTLIGVVSIAISIFAIVYDGTLGTQIAISERLLNTPLVIPEHVFNMFGPATFLFTIHYCILSMGAEMLKENENLEMIKQSDEYDEIERDYDESNLGQEFIQNDKFDTFINSLAVAYFLSTLLIIILGAFAFLYFRTEPFVKTIDGNIESGCEEHVCQNIILNLRKGSIKSIVEISLIISIIFSYIVVIVPAREHIEKGVMRWLPGLNSTVEMCLRNIIRLAIVAFTALVAIRAPYFGAVLGSVGGLTDSLQSLVLPPIIYFALTRINLGTASTFSRVQVEPLEIRMKKVKTTDEAVYQLQITSFQSLMYFIMVGWGIFMIATTMRKLLLEAA